MGAARCGAPGVSEGESGSEGEIMVSMLVVVEALRALETGSGVAYVRLPAPSRPSNFSHLQRHEVRRHPKMPKGPTRTGEPFVGSPFERLDQQISCATWK